MATIDASVCEDFSTVISRSTQRQRILLVCPPFQHISIASLSTAQLATYLRANGAECQEAYLHFELAKIVGLQRYRDITDGAGLSHAELLFSEGYHVGPLGPKYAETISRLFGNPSERDAMREAFEAACVAHLQQARPDVVGLTTSFSQLIASLWMARLIKRRMPAVTVVLGGSACHLPMGRAILDAYPDVDCVVSGYGETPLLALSSGILRTRCVIDNPRAPNPGEVSLPDYESYLRQAEGFEANTQINLVFQSSRGCWWAEKHPCNFCGLNGSQVGFVSKSSERSLMEIRTLWERHGKNLLAADSVMSREHLREVISRLGEFETGPRVFYELKANLTEAEVVALARARILAQIGIESLSTHLLKQMNKGTTAIRNLATLKWCRERRVPVAWNQLCAIPGECEEDYEQQIALMRRIPHFPPPDLANPIKVERFSAYFERFRDFGWTSVEPNPLYRALHPHLDDRALGQIASHFVGLGGVSPSAYFERFAAAVVEWRERNARNDGLFLDPQQGLVLNTPPTSRRYRLPKAVMRVLDCTHRVTTIERVLDDVQCERSTLSEMQEHGMLYIEGDQVLNLTIRTQPPALG